MASGLLCTSCGCKILGKGRRLEGAIYCEDCYQKKMTEKINLDNAKAELYTYITNLFGLGDCPTPVISYIDRALKYGKKIPGIRATIKYYYEIEGHSLNYIEGLGRIIDDNYIKAREYYAQQEEIRKKNLKININVPPKVVTINQQSNTSKKMPKYKMEDL